MARLRINRKKMWLLFLVFTTLVPAMYLIFFSRYASTIKENLSQTTEHRGITDEKQISDHDLSSLPPVDGILRVVHLDLKGAPPRPEYVARLLAELALQGCNALLLEYEDMFPYTDRLVNLSASNAYTQQQVRKILTLARDHSIEVIPLIQTFGHMEFALKLPEFRSLRELDPFPQEICPSNLESMNLVEEMLQQVMALHPYTKYLHIGCDEVFHLAACGKCNDRLLSSNDIYGDHVIAVAQLVKSKYPNVTPLIWDDMVRKWPVDMLAKSTLGQYVEPMVWAYTSDVTRLVRHFTWHWYSKVFKRIWVAGAFKGATTPTSILPNLVGHYENQKSWMKFIETSKVPVGGIVLTGWSRYDHFSVLCELLPVSIPSLLLSLTAVKYYGYKNETVNKKWSKSIECPLQITPESVTNDPKLLTLCRFEGSDLYASILYYESIRTNVETFLKSFTETQGWMTPYNTKHNFTSPFRLLEDHTLYTINQLLESLSHFRNDTKELMNQYYDRYTTEEWLEQKVQPLEQKLKDLLKSMDNLLKIQSWPKRPIR